MTNVTNDNPIKNGSIAREIKERNEGRGSGVGDNKGE